MATEPMPTPAPVVEPQAQISPFGRIMGMFFSPKPTFEDIVRKPTWLLPMAIIVIFALIGVVSLNAHFDWKSYVLQQIEKSPQAASMSAEQKQQRAEVGCEIFSDVCLCLRHTCSHTVAARYFTGSDGCL